MLRQNFDSYPHTHAYTHKHSNAYVSARTRAHTYCYEGDGNGSWFAQKILLARGTTQASSLVNLALDREIFTGSAILALTNTCSIPTLRANRKERQHKPTGTSTRDQTP